MGFSICPYLLFPVQWFVLCIMLMAPSVFASTNPPFVATCQDVLTHGYRDNTDIYGKPMGESWTDDERFHRSWKFVYKGDDHVLLDGKRHYIVAEHPGVLIIARAETNGIASDIWSYAIHLGVEKIVASQVNGHGSFSDDDDLPIMSGVKARSVNLKCVFAFNSDKPPSIVSSWKDIVSQAQRRLKAFDMYRGPIDGELNDDTRSGLRIFQFAEKIPVTGELDKETRKALYIE